MRPSALRAIPRTVFVLGVASFLTDVSSEMIYPLLPVFLATILGAGALSIGVIEGVAESTTAFLKVVSGVWTDRVRVRKPFVVAGYSLAGIARPLIGLAWTWPVVLGLRFVDRVGKGIRTSPRDALIADVTPPEVRGAAYGLHRAMDHAGAVVGPLVAAALVWKLGLPLRTVFLLAAIPAALVLVVLVTLLREPPPAGRRAAPPATLSGWRDLGRNFHVLLAAVLLFTLGNSTDAFLLLRLSDLGAQPEWIAVLWSLFHVVKVVATGLGGRLADRLGRRAMIAAGWTVYAAVYVGFALVDSLAGAIAVFLAYGVHFGLTEPAEKALVAGLVAEDRRGTAFGFYHGAIGLAALPASLLFGLLWWQASPSVAFLAGAGLAGAASAVLLLGVRK